MSDCYTIAGFCQAHKISRSAFYELVKQKRAPAIMRLPKRRVVISPEAAEAWRREREAEACAHAGARP
jgi:predicted DNA-binding transcriptional regulator AlpA